MFIHGCAYTLVPDGTLIITGGVGKPARKSTLLYDVDNNDA